MKFIILFNECRETIVIIIATVPSEDITNLPLLNQNMHKGKCIYNENSPLAESRFGSRILLINA